MSKQLISILLIILYNNLVFGQDNCRCISNPSYNSFISCDTIKFDNGSLLYRQFNCDSSWLTFESKNLDKKILLSLKKEMIDLTPKLGYQFVQEYSNSLLFKNIQYSGGGFPINYELINKKTGTVSKKLGPVLFYSQNQKKELIVTLINDSMPSLSFYDIKSKTSKNYFISKTTNDMINFMSSETFPENHFDNALLEENIFEIEYSYKKNGNNNWFKTKIKLDLSKH